MGGTYYLLDIHTKKMISGHEGYYTTHYEKNVSACLEYIIAKSEIRTGGAGTYNGRVPTGFAATFGAANLMLFEELKNIKIGKIWKSDYNKINDEYRFVGFFVSQDDAEKELIKSGWLNKIIKSQEKAIEAKKEETMNEIKKYNELIYVSEKYKKKLSRKRSNNKP